MRAYLKTRGWPEPMLADSGNGWHLNYRIDLPNDANATALVKGVLEHLKNIFPMVDTANINASGVCKLYGGWARKGEHSDVRPHRKSAVIEQGSDTIVTEEQLRALAPVTEVATTADIDVSVQPNAKKWADLLRFLDEREVATIGKPRKVKGGWQQEIRCPWEDEHSNENSRDTVVSYIEGWGFGFNCRHEHCLKRSWQAFRAEVDPRGEFKWSNEAESVGDVVISESAPTADVQLAEKQPRPVFPDDSWASTVFGEFAEIVCRGSFIRKRLASESFRAITGAIAGDQVTCGISGVRMREYYAVIANRQSGKSYALDCAIRFYSQQSVRCVFEPMLMLDGGSNSYRVSGIGAQRFLPGSSNSFVDELTRDSKSKQKRKKEMEEDDGLMMGRSGSPRRDSSRYRGKLWPCSLVCAVPIGPGNPCLLW